MKNLITLSIAFYSVLFSITASALDLAPTVLPSLAAADELHQNMDTRFLNLNLREMRMGTECTDRATVWAYDMYKTYNVTPFKVFVFYTNAYQNYYYKKHGENFKWWFHTSAAVQAMDNHGQVVERVVDASFTDHPASIHDWTNIFIKSGQQCIENVPFHEFEGDVSGEGKSFDKSAHCYLMRAPMVDKFPADAEAREMGTRTTDEWNLATVRNAARALKPIPRGKFKRRVGL